MIFKVEKYSFVILNIAKLEDLISVTSAAFKIVIILNSLQVYTRKQYVADGCANFYRKHLFKEVEKREVKISGLLIISSEFHLIIFLIIFFFLQVVFSENTSTVVEALQPDLKSEAGKHLTKVYKFHMGSLLVFISFLWFHLILVCIRIKLIIYVRVSFMFWI